MKESKVKNENHIVIHGWMINELQLKGNELIVYAVIYGFSQDRQTKFKGSLQYLADWTGSTKQGVIKNLKSLVDKGHIAKEEHFINDVKYCEYYSTKFNGVLNTVEQGIKQSLPNNINDNIENNIVKHTYGEYGNVRLTNDEIQKLTADYPNADDLIAYLDEYIEMKGYKAKSHYLAIKKWVVKAVEEKNTKPTYSKGRIHYEHSDIKEMSHDEIDDLRQRMFEEGKKENEQINSNH